MSSLELQDLPISLDDVTKLEDSSIFKVEQQPTRLMNFRRGRIMMQVRIELSLDRTLVERDIYNLIEVLSDVGGLQSIFFAIALVISAILNY